jgi:hypothetical protein
MALLCGGDRWINDTLSRKMMEPRPPQIQVSIRTANTANNLFDSVSAVDNSQGSSKLTF